MGSYTFVYLICLLIQKNHFKKIEQIKVQNYSSKVFLTALLPPLKAVEITI